MASSDVELCNLAASLLQIDDPVTSIEIPETATEEKFALWYDTTRKQVLRSHTWNFATKRAQLAKSTDTPEFGWQSKFKLPSDFIRLMYLTSSNSNYENIYESDMFRVEDDYILTGSLNSENSDIVNLVYIYDFTNVPQMDALFIEMFYTKLALNMAYSLTQSNTNIQRIEAMLSDIQKRAMAIDGQESPPIRIERSRALQARSRLGVSSNRGGTVY